MRLFKRTKNINWKYIIGEILLLFIGLSLAIWFNNWNTSNESNKDKGLALDKISEEIKENKERLNTLVTANQNVKNAFSEYQKMFNGKTSEVIARPYEFNEIQKKYPGFFRAKDSAEVGDGVYLYSGGTSIELEVVNFSKIAWETARSVSITREFEYECLYQYEEMYSLQDRVQLEVNKATDALQRGDFNELLQIFLFAEQYGEQLLEAYNMAESNMENCR